MSPGAKDSQVVTSSSWPEPMQMASVAVGGCRHGADGGEEGSEERGSSHAPTLRGPAVEGMSKMCSAIGLDQPPA
jgi:hypothetical protein